MEKPLSCATLQFAVLFTALVPWNVLATENATLASLTRDVRTMVQNQEELKNNFCPTGAQACVEDPTATIDVSTIGGILFVVCVGICVGTDVNVDSFDLVLRRRKRSFICGVISQFGCMPMYAFLLTWIFKDDLTKHANYSYEATVLGLTIVGCLPGGNTSNLFTWFCGGNVPLSILMSLFSNVAAVGMMPLLLHLYYEKRFADASAPEVPYLELMIPLIVTILGVACGMLTRAKASAETIWWTAKISSIVAIVFLFLAVLLGLIRYPHLFTSSYSFWICILTIQPAGYLFGWTLGTICFLGLKDKMTVAFETGVQSFTLGLVMAQLGFNAEKEACQFDSRCMTFLEGTGNNVERYEFSWSGDGRIKEGDKVGMISMYGTLPGQFSSDQMTGGCCRYNESIYLDVFKFSAVCGCFYVIHAIWMIIFFRKIFPGGYPRNTEVIEREEWPSYNRTVVTKISDKYPPVFAAKGAGSEESPAMILPTLIEAAAAKKGREYALAIEWPISPCPAGNTKQKMEGTLSKPWKQWKRWTWSDFQRDIQTAARAFISLGVGPEKSVAIFGFNAPEWHISALAAICTGAVATGLYPTDTKEQVGYKISHSNGAVAVVEDNKKLGVILANEFPNLQAAVMYGEDPLADTGVMAAGDGFKGEGKEVKSSPNKNTQQTDGGSESKSQKGRVLPIKSWVKFMELGSSSGSVADLDKRSSQLEPGSAACLVYTSGTTGMPKAVMLSHDNLCFTSQAVTRCIKNRVGVDYSQERVLSYLPLSHIAGFLNDIISPISICATTKGFCTVYFARPYDLKEGTLKNRLTFVQPTLFFGVPRVYEKLEEGLKAVGEKIAQMTGCRARMPILCCFRKTTVSKWAKSHGLRSARQLQYGQSGKTSGLYGLADALVLSNVRAALGLDQVKLAVTAAAPISVDTLEYFGSLSLTLTELYGMSESTGPTTISTNERHLWGSCGFALPGTQVKVFKCEADINKKKECPLASDIMSPTDAEQGEICFRGRHVMMGYLANPDFGEEHVAEIEKKTKESIDDEGWLHSGDMGCISTSGMVRITGRYKELIITAGGENVAPVPIEDHLKKCCPLLSHVVMIGDKRKFNCCVVTLKSDDGKLIGEAAKAVDGVATVDSACTSDAFKKIIEDAIKATNNNSVVCPSAATKIQKFEILPCEFMVDSEEPELTPTLKVKRKVVEKKYADYIARMYGEEKA